VNGLATRRKSERPTLDLAGQAALVTGASSGIGAAIAETLGAAGARVAVNYRSNGDGADKVALAIREAGGEAIVIKADVSKEDEVERLFAETLAAFGRLDILIANAGLQRDAPAHAMSLDDWREVIDVNLTGQFLCCRAAIRAFLQRVFDPVLSRARGKIVCISSVHEIIPWAGHVNYAASKGGVMLMMKSLAQKVAGDGIRVNSIAPGAIRTPINRAAWETPEGSRSAQADPLRPRRRSRGRRPGRPVARLRRQRLRHRREPVRRRRHEPLSRLPRGRITPDVDALFPRPRARSLARRRLEERTAVMRASRLAALAPQHEEPRRKPS
jgi:glucose 1-dehydrogenase